MVHFWQLKNFLSWKTVLVLLSVYLSFYLLLEESCERTMIQTFKFGVVLKVSVSLKGWRKNKGKPALFVLAWRLSWEEDENTSSAF